MASANVHKAFEYEVKFGKDGKPTARRWSIGPILIIAIVVFILAITGHAIPTAIWSFLR